MPRETRTEFIHSRIRPSRKEHLRVLADEHDRSMSDYLEWLIAEAWDARTTAGRLEGEGVVEEPAAASRS